MSEKVTMPKYKKDEWARGPWDNEPDRVDFLHAGFSCFILRNHSGNWCGYVGVPNTHPSYQKPYDDVDVQVHGGLTYADKCDGHICHVPQPGMPHDVWWFGFDTAHYMDLSPIIARLLPNLKTDAVYRDMEYTINETKKLAEQLHEVKT